METQFKEQVINLIIQALEKNILTIMKKGSNYYLGCNITYDPTLKTVTIDENTVISASDTQTVMLNELVLRSIYKQETQTAKTLIKQLQSMITVVDNIQKHL